MDYGTGALICVGALMVLMMLGLPIAYSLGVAAVTVGMVVYGPISLDKIGWTTFMKLYDMTWSPLPLFFLLACIITATKIGDNLYGTARAWFSRVPGGLVVASIIGQAAMATCVATSAAAIMTIGKIAEPEFKKYGYNKGFAFGGLVCGGVLGPLIPPSSTMIIYSVLSGGVSLGSLFIAGIIPGVVLCIMLCGTAIFMCVRHPDYGPPVKGITWAEKFSSLKKIWPVIVVMLAILGSIYFGIATPTEAAGVGVVVTLIIAVAFFGLRWQGIYKALVESALINAMIMFTFVGSSFFSYVVGSSGLAKTVVEFVATSGLSGWWVVIAINILLLILGCFIDGMTIMMLTIPLFVPIIDALGFNLIWFGILYVVNMQIGLITPPMGMDLFITKSAFKIPIGDLIKGVAPFLVCLLIFMVVLIGVPSFSTWLPDVMVGK